MILSDPRAIIAAALTEQRDTACAQRDHLISVLSRVMRTLRRAAGSPEEQAVYADAREVLAQHGAREAEVAEMQSAYEQWADRRVDAGR